MDRVERLGHAWPRGLEPADRDHDVGVLGRKLLGSLDETPHLHRIEATARGPAIDPVPYLVGG